MNSEAGMHIATLLEKNHLGQLGRSSDTMGMSLVQGDL
jgi:hypothetical protein